jgi:hypothetical protein
MHRPGADAPAARHRRPQAERALPAPARRGPRRGVPTGGLMKPVGEPTDKDRYRWQEVEVLR